MSLFGITLFANTRKYDDKKTIYANFKAMCTINPLKPRSAATQQLFEIIDLYDQELGQIEASVNCDQNISAENKPKYILARKLFIHDIAIKAIENWQQVRGKHSERSTSITQIKNNLKKTQDGIADELKKLNPELFFESYVNSQRQAVKKPINPLETNAILKFIPLTLALRSLWETLTKAAQRTLFTAESNKMTHKEIATKLIAVQSQKLAESHEVSRTSRRFSALNMLIPFLNLGIDFDCLDCLIQGFGTGLKFAGMF